MEFFGALHHDCTMLFHNVKIFSNYKARSFSNIGLAENGKVG